MKMFIVSAALAAAALPASAQQMKVEDQVKQRQSGYAIMGHNFGSLAAMAQDKKPYNREEAQRNAQMVANLADYMRQFFGEGTDMAANTKAKPEIWKKRADFDAKMDKMIAEARRLPQAAGDLPSLKKAVADTGAACKACHDEYKAK
jgi:cytochrome c556